MDELEEAETAKKRRRAVDAAAIAAPVSNDPNMHATPCIAVVEEKDSPPPQETPQIKLGEKAIIFDQPFNEQETPNSSSAPEKDIVPETNPALQSEDSSISQDLSKSDSLRAQAPKEEKEAPQTKVFPKSVYDGNTALDQEATPQSTNSDDHMSGTKTAANQDDMVSLATFENIQGYAAPVATGEPSITSANRLAAIESLSETAAIGSTENRGSKGETSSENFSAGNPSITSVNENFSFQKTATAQASSLLKSLAPELEKFQQTGQSQVQLELPVGDNESVKIRLSLRAGEIRSTFITESPELREALQKAWPDFTATHRTQGVRFGESQFQDSFSRNQDAASQHGRQRQYEQEALASNLSSKQQQAKSNLRIAHQPHPSSKASSSSINLWA